MIELTPQQRQAIQKGEPVRLVDPSTRESYILLRAEVYERIAGGPQRPRETPPAGIDPLLLRSMQAFWQALPDLLRDRRKRGKWVAYHGEECVGIGKRQVELYQQCFGRGLQRGEFYVGKIQADPEGVPPWGTIEADRSLDEVREGKPEGAPPDGV